MSKLKKTAACGGAFIGILTVLLFITSCYWDPETSDYKTFDSDLWGTWISNDPSVYSGTLVIDINSVTITGFSESQTPSGENSNKLPFKDFTKEVALKGYSEDEKIFIEDAGLLQGGIPYTRYSAGNNRQKEFLRFTFGGRAEIMQRQQ